MNIFFVSNSTCYYFADELYGLLAAGGYEDVSLVLAYYSGCSLQRHYEWLCEGVSNYQLRILDASGLHTVEGVSLEESLASRKWDIISFDNNARSFASGDVKTSFDNAEPYLGLLFSEIKSRHPADRYFWHEVWANEIGYSMAFRMETAQQRSRVFQAKRGVAQLMAEKYGFEIVPTGDAWEKVRDLSLFTTAIAGVNTDRFTLCTRVLNGKLKDDFSHDGDIGGGQYLNACVWYEVITGKSCIGNPFRPKYALAGMDCSLSEEKIQVLQNAAHEAVTALR